ncbi:hypothetical protein [Eoetvoesiella caeni]|uniref:Uncharacterized protein n=1 Tax=Eoetvoesiella caeni TaxID=645616 RepID=A0A366GYW8_9BURK|nr:hypothetical protein [Eoetvoesiella caeni]MCI2811298.1 hypothetical protein [Eoetvoesiella caeni]NYT57203.1 hypothetical protein [Eoetvoesiella caeni]RBP33624.1 hypothetical protein DFR37_12615 [Eoetvoesiella caeni]
MKKNFQLMMIFSFALGGNFVVATFIIFQIANGRYSLADFSSFSSSILISFVACLIGFLMCYMGIRKLFKDISLFESKTGSSALAAEA